MSKEIAKITSDSKTLTLTQFHGGEAGGKMIQITQVIGCPKEIKYIQLTQKEAKLLSRQLNKWLKEVEK